jgi:hypothetical protein
MRKACFLSEIFLPSDPEDIERSKTSYELAWIAATQSILLRAKDPRDKVYSLLGIVDTGMKANYSKTIEAIYTEFATILFGHVPLDEWLSITGVGLGPRILLSSYELNRQRNNRINGCNCRGIAVMFV